MKICALVKDGAAGGGGGGGGEGGGVQAGKVTGFLNFSTAQGQLGTGKIPLLANTPEGSSHSEYPLTTRSFVSRSKHIRFKITLFFFFFFP